MSESNAPRGKLAEELEQVAQSARALRRTIAHPDRPLPDEFPKATLDGLAASLAGITRQSVNGALPALIYAEERLRLLRGAAVQIAGDDLPEVPRGGALDLAIQRLYADVGTARACFVENAQEAAEASAIPEQVVAAPGSPEMQAIAMRSGEISTKSGAIADELEQSAAPGSVRAENLIRSVRDIEALTSEEAIETSVRVPRPRLIDRLNRAVRESVDHVEFALRGLQIGSDIAKAAVERFAHASTGTITVWIDALKEFCGDVLRIIARYKPEPVATAGVRSAPSAGNRMPPESSSDQLLAYGLAGPEMVVIPAGRFLMGSPDKNSTEDKALFLRHGGTAEEWADLDDGQDDERPCREVRIDDRLAVGRYPVTFEEYDRFAEATGRDEPDDEGWGRRRRPVINVSWHDAKAYAEWLAHETGKPYRLLSEAEWEYACRAGTRTGWHWGNREPGERDANFASNVEKTTEVGAYPANAWGLHDMHGNVWEWVEDAWHDNYRNAPADGRAWTGSSDPPLRVLRGGSWNNDPRNLRSALRYGDLDDVRYFIVGFRLARTLS